MPQSKRIGGGGGACAIYIKDKNLTILGVHLGIKEELSKEEIDEISNFLKNQENKGRKILLMGDFNRVEKSMDKYPEFKELNLTGTNRRGTYPNIEEIKLIDFKAIDNIFHDRSIVREKSCIVEGYSNHLLVWADLKVD